MFSRRKLLISANVVQLAQLLDWKGFVLGQKTRNCCFLGDTELVIEPIRYFLCIIGKLAWQYDVMPPHSTMTSRSLTAQ